MDGRCASTGTRPSSRATACVHACRVADCRGRRRSDRARVGSVGPKELPALSPGLRHGHQRRVRTTRSAPFVRVYWNVTRAGAPALVARGHGTAQRRAGCRSGSRSPITRSASTAATRRCCTCARTSSRGSATTLDEIAASFGRAPAAADPGVHARARARAWGSRRTTAAGESFGTRRCGCSRRRSCAPTSAGARRRERCRGRRTFADAGVAIDAPYLAPLSPAAMSFDDRSSTPPRPSAADGRRRGLARRPVQLGRCASRHRAAVGAEYRALEAEHLRRHGRRRPVPRAPRRGHRRRRDAADRRRRAAPVGRAGGDAARPPRRLPRGILGVAWAAARGAALLDEERLRARRAHAADCGQRLPTGVPTSSRDRRPVVARSRSLDARRPALVDGAARGELLLRARDGHARMAGRGRPRIAGAATSSAGSRTAPPGSGGRSSSCSRRPVTSGSERPARAPSRTSAVARRADGHLAGPAARRPAPWRGAARIPSRPRQLVPRRGRDRADTAPRVSPCSARRSSAPKRRWHSQRRAGRSPTSSRAKFGICRCATARPEPLTCCCPAAVTVEATDLGSRDARAVPEPARSARAAPPPGRRRRCSAASAASAGGTCGCTTTPCRRR